MLQITVGIGECKISSDPHAMLVTYGLGSCIGVAAWHPETHAAAMLHFMFPDSASDPERLRCNPYLFADSGIPALLRLIAPSQSDRHRLIVRAAGGASVLHGPSLFNIGERNRESLKHSLAKAGVTLTSRALGGTVARTLRLEINTGRCWVEYGRRSVELSAHRAGVCHGPR